MILKSCLPLSYVVCKTGESKIRLPKFPASFFFYHFLQQGDGRLLTPCERRTLNLFSVKESWNWGKNIYRRLLHGSYKLIVRPTSQ